MVANLNVSNGRVACLTFGALPWHREGHNAPDEVNDREFVADKSNTNWTVMQIPMLYPFKIGMEGAIDLDALSDYEMKPAGLYANVRMDTGDILGTSTDRYEIFQNSELLDLAQIVRDTDICTWDTAGALGKGENVWYGLKFNDMSEISSKDGLTRQICFTTTHDRSGRIRIFVSLTRIVCQNTWNIAVGRDGSKGLAFTHSKKLKDNIENVKKNLSLIHECFGKFDEKAKYLSEKPVTMAQMTEYTHLLVDELFGKPADEVGLIDKILDTKANRVSLDDIIDNKEFSVKEKHKVTEFFNILKNFDDETNLVEGAAHTGWGAYNAVTLWCNHQQRYRGSKFQENRLKSIAFGGKADDFNQTALELALKTF